MAALPDPVDPTLAAADAALVAAQVRRTRPYLGMSALGGDCARALWYGFRWASLADFDAATLKRFADGHATEAVAIARLKRVDGLELHDVDECGRQFGFEDLGGHLKGHMDGVALGLKQAPATWHVVEIKATAEKKLAALRKAVREHGGKQALAVWNPTYHAQAVLYMHYAGLTRHWLVACTPGGRDWYSVRTDADPVEAARLIERARTIVTSDHPPARIGGPDFFQCRWCDRAAICHDGASADRNCRTCLHATANLEGGWSCARHPGLELDHDQQAAGCARHLFLPGLVPGEQVDACENSVSYRMPDGSTWVDGGAA
jgi:hypothetical protein